MVVDFFQRQIAPVADDLIAKLAEGGMGWVYKGKNKQTGQIVAIKIVPAHMARNDTLLRRFEQEWLAADRYTIADINMFGYVSMAHEGAYDMTRFPAIGAWLDRVRAQPDWIPLLEEAAK